MVVINNISSLFIIFLNLEIRLCMFASRSGNSLPHNILANKSFETILFLLSQKALMRFFLTG